MTTLTDLKALGEQFAPLPPPGIHYSEPWLEAFAKIAAAWPKLIAVAEAAKDFMREGKSYEETEAKHVALEKALAALEGSTHE